MSEQPPNDGDNGGNLGAFENFEPGANGIIEVGTLLSMVEEFQKTQRHNKSSRLGFNKNFLEFASEKLQCEPEDIKVRIKAVLMNTSTDEDPRGIVVNTSLSFTLFSYKLTSAEAKGTNTIKAPRTNITFSDSQGNKLPNISPCRIVASFQPPGNEVAVTKPIYDELVKAYQIEGGEVFVIIDDITILTEDIKPGDYDFS